MSRTRLVHPSGAGAHAMAVRARPGAPPDLEDFLVGLSARADLAVAHVAVALEVVALAPGSASRRTLTLLLLLVLDEVRRGSTHLPIAGARARDALRRRCAELEVPEADVRALERVLLELLEKKAGGQLALGLGDADTRLSLSPFVGRAGERAPLVLDGAGLAPARLEAEERELGALLSARRAVLAPAPAIEAALSRTASARLDARGATLDATQVAAVRAALSHPVTVVTGGPGTGKTSIVVAILRTLARLPGAPVAAAGIALAAPTGKAADRMRAAIDGALGRATAEDGDAPPAERAIDATLRAELPEPRTLHRLLGYHAGSDRFRHHEGNPLAERLVVLDEASMLDVGLFRRLVLALGDDAVLVVLGDRDQLPSVDAGAVLADLVRAAEGGAGALCLATLETSHRMREDDPAGAHVLSIARALRTGAAPPLSDAALAPGAIARADDPRALPPGVSLLPTAAPGALARFADAWLDAELDRRGTLALRTLALEPDRLVLAPADETEVRALLVRTSEARLLCLTRGPGLRTGAERLNEHLSARYRARLDLGGRSRLTALEPLVVGKNDYERGLFNGDTGLVVSAAAPGGPPRLFLAAEKRGGIALFLLDDVEHLVERAWALTVHRAQGSEHDAIALVLPDADVPGLLVRELVYTALTRARRTATIVGSHAMLALAAGRTSERTTALRVT